MNDSKLLLEEQTSRNTLLEKKQRKFDAEIGLLQQDKQTEISAKEKLQREVDQLRSLKFQLEDQMNVSSTVEIYDSRFSFVNIPRRLAGQSRRRRHV